VLREFKPTFCPSKGHRGNLTADTAVPGDKPGDKFHNICSDITRAKLKTENPCQVALVLTKESHCA